MPSRVRDLPVRQRLAGTDGIPDDKLPRVEPDFFREQVEVLLLGETALRHAEAAVRRPGRCLCRHSSRRP